MRTDRSDTPRIDADDARPPLPSTKGTLILIGGAISHGSHAFRVFLDECNARDGARIVGLTTASAEPEANALHWARAFRSMGAANIEIPILRPKSGESDDEVAEQIDGADAVFLGGGDQVRLVSCLTGTKTLAALRALSDRGGVVCGTSAGAAALTRLTMAGGEMDLEGKLVEEYLGPGLGLLGEDVIVDTHFTQRRRLQRLFLVVALNTELFGVGIDEDTALVVKDGLGRVVGAGGVTFVDGRDTARFDNAHDLQRARQLTISHLRVGIVGSNYHLDLKQRDVHELVPREPSAHLRPAPSSS